MKETRPLLAAARCDADRDEQFVVQGIGRIPFLDAAGVTANLAYQLAAFPSRPALDVRRFVLDLFAGRRDSSNETCDRCLDRLN